MSGALCVGAVLRVPDLGIGEVVVDELFDPDTAAAYALSHPVGPRCDQVVGRDPGDNLIVMAGGLFCYWDHESDRLISLGRDPSQFVVRVEARDG